MNEENNVACEASCQAEKPKPIVKKKRDIFRFVAKEDLALDLGHIFKIIRREKRIEFHIPVPSYEDKKPYAEYVDFETEEAATKAFEQIIAIWSADVVE